MSVPVGVAPVAAGAIPTGERTLYLHHTHTGQTARFTYMRNGRYDPEVLRQLNVFLADWRTKDQIKMDPHLFDLIWTIYREVGATQPVNIVSSYRSPKTNAFLRANSSGVAENSQHMTGKAMDIFIPGVALPTLRATAMRHQVGGVGFYPTSGSPFVHVDTGSVRAWPRMTRAQLQKVFPDGQTLHLPVDGKPLSASGRRYAELEWKKCHMVPCSGSPAPSVPSGADLAPGVMAAGLTAPIPAGRRPFAGTPAPQEPARLTVATVSIAAPLPVKRPGAVVALAAVAAAPIPASKSPTIRLATGPALPGDGDTALKALASIGDAAPAPRVLMSPREDLMVTAYVPATVPEPGAERALQMIIAREATGSLGTGQASAAKPAPVTHQASLAPPGGVDALADLFQNTWDAVSGLSQPQMTAALQARVAPPPNTAFKARQVEFATPGADHDAEPIVEPFAMSSAFFAEMYEPEGFLDKTTEVGALVTRFEFDRGLVVAGYDHFVVGSAQLVASR